MSDPTDLERLAGYAELADGLTFAHSERDRLIRRMRADGVTLQVLADAAGVDQSRISRIAKESNK